MEELSNYVDAAVNAGGILFILVVGITWLFRKRIKAFLSSIFGYRVSLDDFSFAMHKNRDIIYANKTEMLRINFLDAAWVMAATASLLVSPYLFVAILGLWIVQNAKAKMRSMQSFPVFDTREDDSYFYRLINENTMQLDKIVKSGYLLSFVFMGTGVMFGEFALAIAGIIVAGLILLSTLVGLGNVAMYKTNYKPLLYFRTLRILEASALGRKQDLTVLGTLGFYTNFTELAGFSPYIWLIFAIKMAADMAMTNMLKGEEKIAIQHQEIENRDYEKIETAASYPNAKSQSRGYMWTTPLQLKFFELEKKKGGKNLIFLDHYAFYPQMVNRSGLRYNPILKNEVMESVSGTVESLDLTKQLLVLGGMGSGKTEMINSIIKQVHDAKFTNFKSIIYNDIKGDYVLKFYRPDKDHIVNLFDADSSVWCIFTEMKYNIEVGTNFINNLFESIAGKEKDFFTGRAKQLTGGWLKESFFSTENNIDAWEMFFDKMQKYKVEVEKKDDKTKSSILQTIEIAIEILSIMRYQVVAEKRKIFSIYEFIRAEDTQLFLVSDKQFEQKLTPYLAGVWGAIATSMLGKEDTKEHLILSIMDEFLSLGLDVSTLKSFLTATRSKGLSNILGLQYLPKQEDLVQNLDSSRYAMVTFNINDDYTLEKVSKKLAEAEMLIMTASRDKGKDGIGGEGISKMVNGIGTIAKNMIPSGENYDKSYSLGNIKVAIQQQLQSMPKYHHLTFIPSEEVKVLDKNENDRFFRLMAYGYEDEMYELAEENPFLEKQSGILYLGYTPPANVPDRPRESKKWDMSGYYQNKNKIDAEIEKKLEISEREAYIHYVNVSYGESAEHIERYMIDNGLHSIDLEKLFKPFQPNKNKIKKLIDELDYKEREALLEEFFAAESPGKQYDFLKKRDILDALPDIFQFDDIKEEGEKE